MTTHTRTPHTIAAPFAVAAALLLGVAAAETHPDRASFFSEPLHDIEVPEAGRFAIEIEGERHEGDVRGICSTDLASDVEGGFMDAFVARGDWTDDDGRAWAFEVTRNVSDMEAMWRRSGPGHESDRVWLHVREDGNRSRVTSRGNTGTEYGDVWVYRVDPGDDEVRVDNGEAVLPMVRVAEDGVRATAEGVVATRDRDEGFQPFELAFRLAVHCPS